MFKIGVAFLVAAVLGVGASTAAASTEGVVTSFTLTPGSTEITATWTLSKEEPLQGVLVLVPRAGHLPEPVQYDPEVRSPYQIKGLKANTTYIVDVFVDGPKLGNYLGGGEATTTTTGTAGAWKPAKGETFYWQITGTLPAPSAHAEKVWFVDGEETTAAQVAALHAAGKRAVCYVDVGTAEDWREDYSSFPASVKGAALPEWPGEYFLNYNDLSILQPIMTHRFEKWCKAKGFDGVEPDNMDTWEETNNGFPSGTLTVAGSNTYDEWIATEVHSLGMAVFQKNDGEETSTLKSHFDGVVTEQCNQYSECENFTPYLAEGKPVWNAEYNVATGSFCSKDEAAGIVGAKFKLELGATGFKPCSND